MARRILAASVAVLAFVLLAPGRYGSVYLYVGTVPGPYFVVYKPDAHVPESSSTARGVWRVPSTLATRDVAPATPTAPPSTRG